MPGKKILPCYECLLKSQLYFLLSPDVLVGVVVDGLSLLGAVLGLGLLHGAVDEDGGLPSLHLA